MNNKIATSALIALSTLSAFTSCTSTSTEPVCPRESAWNAFTLVSVPATSTQTVYVEKAAPVRSYEATPAVSATPVVIRTTKQTITPPPSPSAAQETEYVPTMPGRGRALRSTY